MIRKISNLKDCSELVGKFVFKAGPYDVACSLSRPHLVTKTAKTRIYLSRSELDYEKRRPDGSRPLSPVSGWEEESYCDMKSIVVACDTFDEAQHVYDVATASVEAWFKARKELDLKAKADFEQLISSS